MLSSLAAAHADALASLGRSVAALRGLGWQGGAALVAGGGLCLVAGGRPRRLVALFGGALAGALAGFILSGPAARALGASSATTMAAGAAAAGLAAALAPPLFPLVLGAVVGGALGTRLPLGHPAVGAALGGVVLAGLALLAARPLAAGLAGIAGAAAAVAGLVALEPALPTAALGKHPLVACAVVLVLGVAGAAAQLEHAWGGGKPSRRGGLEPPPRAETEE